MAGECEGDQESTREEERRTGKSMAVKAAHVRMAEKIVPSDAGDTRFADVLAGAERVRAAGGRLHPTDAESVDGNECASGDGTQRSERGDGDEPHSIHSGR